MDTNGSSGSRKIVLLSGIVCFGLALFPYRTTTTTKGADSTVTTTHTTLGLPFSPLFFSDQKTTRTGPADLAAAARQGQSVTQTMSMSWSRRLNITSLSFLALVAGIVLLILGLNRPRRGPKGEAVVPTPPPAPLP
jgi:hypothetical protein